MVSRIDHSQDMKPGIDSNELLKRKKELEESGEELDLSQRSEARQCGVALNCRRYHFRQIVRDAGERYADTRIDNFNCLTDKHTEALNAVKRYLRDCEGGPRRDLLFIGPTGTGKDHLMMSVLRSVIHKWGTECHWMDGQQFFSDIRTAYAENEGEADILNELSRCPVLAISDPLPAVGRLTDHQMNVFGIVMDRRNRNLKPTFATVNVASRAELYDRLGDRNADRLCEDAVVIPCNWSSYRQRSRPAPFSASHQVQIAAMQTA